MPIDAYSLCPGGTGKKVKFCCSDLTGDLEKLSKMLEGDQYMAGVRYIERLEEKFSNRACLLAIKAEVLDALNNQEAHRATAARFVELYPDSALAHAEMALAQASSEEDPRPAFTSLLRSFSLIEDTMSPRIYAAIEPVAFALLESGFYHAARALLLLRYSVGGHEAGGYDTLARLNGHPSVLLCLKQEPMPRSDLGDVPWRAEFLDAIEPLAHVRWDESERRHAALAEKIGNSPLLWRNLATLREWLVDTHGAAEALRRYAALCSSLEDAAEALAVASVMANPPVGDRRDLFSLEYEVADPDALNAALAASPRVLQIPLDSAMFAEMPQPWPRAAYVLLDRPRSSGAGAAEIQIDDVPRRLANCMFYGRETDRAARLVMLAVSADRVDAVRAAIAEIAGTAVDAEHVSQEPAGTQPAMAAMLQSDWLLIQGTVEDTERLAKAHLQKAVHERWMQTPWEVLDGKTPAEVAGQPDYQTRLMAATILLDSWLNYLREEFDLNPLREQLGLPQLGPIESPVDADALDAIPITRLVRVKLDQLNDELLVLGMQKAISFQAIAAAKRFARAVLDRPQFYGKGESLLACQYLLTAEPRLSTRLEIVTQARERAEATGGKVGMYRLLELSLFLTNGMPEQGQAVLEVLQTRHMEEPGVAEGVINLLVRLGLIRPDGSPAQPMEPPPAAGVVVPGAVPGAEPGKLWVPGGSAPPAAAPSQQPPGQKPSGLWVPD